MKNLTLIRHSKSSWNLPLLDKDRPLSRRGIQDAHLVSLEISKHLPKVNMIWSSSSRRTRETSIIFAQNLSWPLESIIYNNKLYTFDEFELENSIKHLDNSYDNVIIFGHNNAITNFVNKFGSIFIENVPTTGVVVLSFDVNSWKEIKKGTTVKKIFPRELKI